MEELSTFDLWMAWARFLHAVMNFLATLAITAACLSTIWLIGQILNFFFDLV